MSQTAAIFLDAYRDLNAKKLFWVVLGLSGLVVLAFLAVGMGDQGISFFGMNILSDPRTPLVERRTFYVGGLFLALGVDFWLGIIATVLALVSTAGIFPELIASGSIDLYLSRPIGRLRLFFTRYLAAMSFVFLQVLVFTAGSFLVLGIRAGEWLPGIFLAVPVVVVFYSYLYCVCVLIGLLTRSTIAAMLLTIVFWLAIFGVHLVETASLMNMTQSQVGIERLTPLLGEREAKLQKFDAEGGEATQLQKRDVMVNNVETARRNLASAHDDLSKTWHPAFYAVKTVLPKTSETVALLQRWLKIATEPRERERRGRFADENKAEDAPAGSIFRPGGPDFMKAQQRVHEEVQARSVGWVAGTSLAFEAVILGIAAWIFCRRDY